MPERLVVLVVGPARAGKTSLIRRLVDGEFPQHAPPSTPGLDMSAGLFRIPVDQARAAGPALAARVPPGGLELEVWEIGGREAREAPRGAKIDGVLLCYDARDRSSFQRAPNVLLRHRMDHHRGHVRSESVLECCAVRTNLPAVLCGTKNDDPSLDQVRPEEVQQFVEAHSLQGAVLTSASTGSGVLEAFHALAAAALEARQRAGADEAAVAQHKSLPAAHAWSLPESPRGAAAAAMTSPRGFRPLEPARGEAAAPLIEVLGAGPAAPRTLARCLEQGLLHRAVHVWVCVARTGALLLRKWGQAAAKHPGCWGPTCHGEVHCYGAGGDGHAAEVSAQAAERLLREQLGVDAADVGELQHWFSCTSRDGQCCELLDIYVTVLEGKGLPPVSLRPDEVVDWVFFGELFGEKAGKFASLFHIEAEYRASMCQRLRAQIVRPDVLNAFGDVL